MNPNLQFNLLPDVKLEHIKAIRLKRLILIFSSLAAGVSLTVLVLLVMFVQVVQKGNIKDLDSDISAKVSEIQNREDLAKILTVQNQLNSLPGLHDQKVVGSRLVDYLLQITPQQTTISDIEADFEANTMVIEGNAAALSVVNKYVNTFKAAKFTINEKDKKDDQRKSGNAFTEVVLDSYEIENQNNITKPNGGPIAFKIKMKFDPLIFKIHKDTQPGLQQVVLRIPGATGPGGNLFAPQADQQQQTLEQQRIQQGAQ